MPLRTFERIIDVTGIEIVVSRTSSSPFVLRLYEASKFLGVPPEELATHKGIPGIQTERFGRGLLPIYDDQALFALSEYFTQHPLPEGLEQGTRNFRTDPLTGTAVMEFADGRVTRQMVLKL